MSAEILPLPVASPRALRRRVRDLSIAGAALVLAGGWWVAIVALTPAADRTVRAGDPGRAADATAGELTRSRC